MRADQFARRVGMDRREFIASTMGMATALSVFNLASGCGTDGLHSDNDAGDFATPPPTPATGTSAAAAMAMGGRAESASHMDERSDMSGDGSRPSMGDDAPTGRRGDDPDAGMAGDGGFVVSRDMCMNADMADRLFKKDYFILDMQTRHFGSSIVDTFGASMNDCGNGANAGYDERGYIQSIFADSDTAVAVLTSFPAPLGDDGTDLLTGSNAQIVASRDRINKAFVPGADRVLTHCQTDPFAGPELNGALMERFLPMRIRGWECQTALGANDGETGWFLTDEVGIQFVKKAIELNQPLIGVHKGYPLGPTYSRKHADPMPDVGKIATMFPDVAFVVYNSAGDSNHVEGPFEPTPDPAMGGTDRLAWAVRDAGLRGKNVYAELGMTWRLNMWNPVRATHYLGKMLKYVGEERVVWGTNAIVFGSPQCQIEAMKAFKMDSGLVEMHGYPDLTDDLKRKLFGLTAARLHRIDPDACRYAIDQSQLALHRQTLDSTRGPRRWALRRTAQRGLRV